MDIRKTIPLANSQGNEENAISACIVPSVQILIRNDYLTTEKYNAKTADGDRVMSIMSERVSDLVIFESHAVIKPLQMMFLPLSIRTLTT